MRSPVDRGSMPYSAVTQPCPEPLSHFGVPLAMLAVQMTCVWPISMRQEPSA